MSRTGAEKLRQCSMKISATLLLEERAKARAGGPAYLLGLLRHEQRGQRIESSSLLSKAEHARRILTLC